MMGRTTRADEPFGTGHILAQDAHEIERLASAHLCKSLLVNFCRLPRRSSLLAFAAMGLSRQGVIGLVSRRAGRRPMMSGEISVRLYAA
jgi:hypothetical protein